MLTLRKAEDRGKSDLGWLTSYHTFSFGGYSDPNHMGFRALRVLNDDRVAAGKGFGAHGHRDMEILSYVLEGKLAHKDSMGEEHVLGPNEVQAMSAGSGVIHSEFNPSPTEWVHLLQIWIQPSDDSVDPSYQRFAYPSSATMGRLLLLAGPRGQTEPPVVQLHQDARMYATTLDAGTSIDFNSAPGRHVWLQCVRGGIEVNGVSMQQGDGLAASDEACLRLSGAAPASELLLFDLA